MGRLRNLSQSLKAAAFQNSSGGSSPAHTNRAGATEDPLPAQTTTKDVPASDRETSSTSLNDIPSTSRRIRSDSRPTSQLYEPPTMGAAGNSENVQELQPVFGFLSSHQNKLYQEGYFLKLNDLDTHGKPNTDRNWTECFAQLVGTVLSLWDAAALDAAGQDGEVAPTFINLADASIKMIETLPTRNNNVQPLQNVLSVSTAGKNRYLLHFNSLHSLTQWTAGIRLSMFENTSLQEVYTGALIAGKGKYLNNIRTIMERTRFREEDWCRVRFGAGTPWRRCWYVIEPPDEKELQKANKTLKKRGPYDKMVYPKGDLKFYDTRKTKKATPIATISDVYSAYAVYPQSKPLIEQSTLVKLEGRITIHSKPESQTEGFVFVMPEVHPAVSGFEMLLRFLFPIYDTFNLYGRPTRLIADTLDPRGLMFAMPKDRRYGYLDIIDVAGLIHTTGSDKWHEREWRTQLKELISRRMSMAAAGRPSNVNGSRRSLGSRPGGIRFGDTSPISNDLPSQSTDAVFQAPKKTHTAPSSTQSVPTVKSHHRSISEAIPMTQSKKRMQKEYIPSRLSVDREVDEEAIITPPPVPNTHRAPYNDYVTSGNVMQSNHSSDSDLQHPVDPEDVTKDLPVSIQQQPPTPVAAPTFQHQPNDLPIRKPRDRPDLRREKSRMSNATLSQLVDASKNGVGSPDAGAAAAAAWKHNGRYDDQARGVNANPDNERSSDANSSGPAMVIDNSQAIRSHSAASIARKPLPRTTSEQSVTRKPLPAQAFTISIPTDTGANFEYSSRPIPNRSLSAEYANTKLESRRAEKSKRINGGARKIVGDPDYDESERKTETTDFDFGITQKLTPNPSRPSTAQGLSSMPQHDRTPSASRTPQDERQTYFGRSSPAPPRTRPVSQLWQPGSVPGGIQSSDTLNAEDFVQQRAAAARIPQGQVPRRSHSSNRVEEIVASAASPKRLQKRTNSGPKSRNPLLDFSGQLSAREQEHVARVTGGPLLNITDQSRKPDPNIGLIGAIETREQEKRVAKEGVSSHLAQAELARRHQQAYLQQMQAQNIQRGNAFAQPQGQWLQQQPFYMPNNQYPPVHHYSSSQQYPMAENYSQTQDSQQIQRQSQRPQQASRYYSQQPEDYYYQNGRQQ